MRNDYLVIGMILLAAFTYNQWRGQQEKFYPGAVVSSVPVQKSVFNPKPFPFKKYTIHPFAEFEIKALVLSSQRYFWERGAELVPVDLALGWGPMSDGDVLKDLTISQGNRWYMYHYQKPPIPISEIVSHSANMHLIPSTEEVAKEIGRAHKGSVVEFKGYLVNVKAEDGFYWNSSQTRTDSGGGSCELVWVEEFKILDI